MSATDFAFIQTAPGRVFIGWGPFEQLPFRRPDRPAFFVGDFFLDDPHPWRHPATWEETSFDELASRFEDLGVPRVAWDAASPDEFTRLFESAHAAMERGDFKKIVPVIFESGRFTERGDWWRWFFTRLAQLPAGMRGYGYSYKNHGLAGATPEFLFQTESRGYRTMALAGTRPVARAEELLRDPKELREHRFVVDDIVRRLAPFGNIEIGPLGTLRLPKIAHLITPIFFRESGGSEQMSFSEMVRRLHPTAALGVSPRTEAGERWLREADRGVKRRTFGAPFGLEREDRSALALVAIRNLDWSGERVRVGSGAGMLLESRVEREFEELREKREQVKALFGVTAHVETFRMTNIAEARRAIEQACEMGATDFCVCAGSRNSPLLAVLGAASTDKSVCATSDKVVSTGGGESSTREQCGTDTPVCAGDLRIFSFVDERSAAFFALGRAKLTGRPVAVVTTSGTAVAELLPAAVEAHYSATPLIFITADRPARYRGTGAPQAIEQEGIFGVYARGCVTHINVEF